MPKKNRQILISSKITSAKTKKTKQSSHQENIQKCNKIQIQQDSPFYKNGRQSQNNSKQINFYDEQVDVIKSMKDKQRLRNQLEKLDNQRKQKKKQDSAKIILQKNSQKYISNVKKSMKRRNPQDQTHTFTLQTQPKIKLSQKKITQNKVSYKKSTIKTTCSNPDNLLLAQRQKKHLQLKNPKQYSSTKPINKKSLTNLRQQVLKAKPLEYDPDILMKSPNKKNRQERESYVGKDIQQEFVNRMQSKIKEMQFNNNTTQMPFRFMY